MVKIFVDKRELRSPVAKELDRLHCDLEFRTLEIGDYIVSDRCAAERKTADDFFNTLFNKLLFGQLYDLARAYERPVLLFEGYENEMFSTRNVGPKQIQGILTSIPLMRIPILYTLNPAGTAAVLNSLAKHEQEDNNRAVSVHGKRTHKTDREQKEYVISSFPGCDIGGKMAVRLLTHFGSIENIVNASEEELQEVFNIGDITASKIRKLLSEEY